MTARIVAHGTHAKDDPERATLPFVFGNVAAAADQEAVVLLTIDGVWLATKGYADDMHKDGLPPLGELIQTYVAGGGRSGRAAHAPNRAALPRTTWCLVRGSSARPT